MIKKRFNNYLIESAYNAIHDFNTKTNIKEAQELFEATKNWAIARMHNMIYEIVGTNEKK